MGRKYSLSSDEGFFGGGENIFAEKGSWGVMIRIVQVLMLADLSPLYFA
jgi:hypothetical protein